jgi:hypothetical protein
MAVPVIEIAGKQVHANNEGFLTEYNEWDKNIVKVLADQIGIAMDTTTTAPSIVPNFDSDSSEGRKLAIICSKDNLDMVYLGLNLRNAALHIPGTDLHMTQMLVAIYGHVPYLQI